MSQVITRKDFYKLITKLVRSAHEDDKSKFDNELLFRVAVEHRAKYLFIFALILCEHRKKFANYGNPLLGQHCLNHLLITQCNISIFDVEKLSFPQALLLVHNQIRYRTEELEKTVGIPLDLEPLYTGCRQEMPHCTNEDFLIHAQFGEIRESEFPIDEFHLLEGFQLEN